MLLLLLMLSLLPKLQRKRILATPGQTSVDLQASLKSQQMLPPLVQ
jgi:hypothetical protein